MLAASNEHFYFYFCESGLLFFFLKSFSYEIEFNIAG